MADDPSDGDDKDGSSHTVRDLKGPVLPGDTLPDMSGLYVPPRPLPEVSQHRTIDLKSVRLSDQADPRRWLTERRLVSPPSPVAKRSKPWLVVTGAVLLLGVVAWSLFRTSRPPASSARAAARPTDAAIAASKRSIAADANRSASPAVPAAKAASSGAAPSPTVEASSLPTQKASRPREPAKKRKDPWLE